MGKTSRRAVLLIALLASVLAALPAGSAAAASAATTRQPTNITSTSATLNGTISIVGPAQYHFEYGRTTSYGASTPVRSFAGGSGNVSEPVEHLAPGTTYHYRLVVVGIYTPGRSNGNDVTFTTPVTPATTGQASDVKPNSAMLNGVATTQASSSTWFFQYGRTKGYGHTTPRHTIPQGLSLVSARISGLRAHTTYHFRLVVQQTGQPTDFGADSSFRTLPFGHAVLRGHRLRVRHGVAAIPFKCKGPRGAPCRGRISLTTQSRVGTRTVTVSCGKGRLVAVARHRKSVRVRIGGACEALLRKASHGLPATLKARFKTHQHPLRARVTLRRS